MNTKIDAALQIHEQGNLDLARTAYEDILRETPHNAEANFLLGVVHYQQGDTAGSLPFLQRAAGLDGKQSRYFNQLGLTFRRLGEIEKALMALQKAVDLAPQTAIVHNNLGLVLKDLKRPLDAIKHFSLACQHAPTNPEIFMNLGHHLRDMNMPAEAATAYSRVIELAPERAQPYAEIGLLAQHGRDYALAAGMFEKALALQPSANYRHLLASVRGEQPTTAPHEYVQTLFDTYADTFDTHLTSLGYDAPSRVAGLVAEVLKPTPKSLAVLDLGCGTGAVGRALAPWASWMGGVDLSERMLEKSQQGGSYSELYLGHIPDILAGLERPIDLVTAADVIIYVGALEAFMAGVAKVLRPGGHLVLTTEHLDDAAGPFRLGHEGRFSHATSYVVQQARRVGLTDVVGVLFPLRAQHNETLPGALILFNK
jgi:predicted TPR repeat methyltransferase